VGKVLPCIRVEINTEPLRVSRQTEPDSAGTLFSQARFVNAIVQAMGNSCRSIELRSETCRSSIFGVETVHSYGRRSVALAPFDLYAHPSGPGDLDAALTDILRELKTLSTATFHWSVRFDHAELAEALARRGLPFSRPATHVLPLNGDYETSFAKFSSTARRHVRRAQSDGVVVRCAHDADDIRAYYEVHTRLAAAKGNYRSIYPKAMFDELVKLDKDVVFVVAEVQKKIAGGAWFFRDGRTMLYWHGAMDREYSRYYPSYAIQAYAIRMAHEEGRTVFNFGGSVGIASLERFKSAFGAEPQCCWYFSWQNPLWRTLRYVRRAFSF